MQSWPEDYKKAVEFHGHSCPGLAIGYRAARAALKELGARAADEERVCEVQNDSCAVDAIQSLMGCTFGKGNLVFKDYGKQVYYFWTRDDDRPALRISLKQDNRGPGKPRSEFSAAEWESYKNERIQWLLTASDQELFDIRHEDKPVPPKARILGSVSCNFCGEKVMETRTRILDGKAACIPCYEKLCGC